VHCGEEARDLFTQRICLLRQPAGRARHLLRGRAGRIDCARDGVDVAGNLTGPRRRLADRVHNLLRRETLLRDGRRDGFCDVADLADGAADALNRGDRVAFAVWPDRFLTSESDHGKQRPASPARAASIVALSASKLAWLAIALIMSVTAPILAAASARLLTRSLVRAAAWTASPAIAEDVET
jgi:hypothetical protein